MKKFFNKAVLNGTTVMGDGLTYPRIPNVYTGDNEGGYQRGDMMDANAVVEMIKELTDTGEITIEELQNLINEEIQERVEGDQDQQRYTDEKIKDLIGTSPETLDTLKEIADALGEDPDFAANVWNKIAELTTKHNEDVQELQDAITSGFENIDFTPYVKKTDIVTDTTNGLMLASDKTKLDAFKGADQYTKAINLPDEVLSYIDFYNPGGGMRVLTTIRNLSTGKNKYGETKLPVASSNETGLMSSFDKRKLDSLVNYQAGNGIDITGNTISCTLDTSLYSIVTELPETGLPNKIYLLPSTETEEGNIYTEYGYVDNKWEEIGKYKSDVDLSPYERALNLPSDVIKTLGVQSGANYVNVYSYKEDLDRGILSEVSEFDIPIATSEKAGIITAQDKAKLDGIEAGAQVNKIESVSVNGTPLEITNKGVNIPIHEYTAGDGIKLENGKFSLDTIEHTERSYTTKLIGPKEEPALNIPIVDESGKLNKNILIPNVADLFDRTPTEWTGEIDDLGCIRYEDYKRLDDYYYNFTKNVFFYPIQDNQLLMYNIGNGIDDDKLSDFLKNPDNYDNWNIPAAIYLSDGLLFDGGAYGEIPVHDPNDNSKTYYPGGVFGFKVNIDKSKNNLLTFTEGEDYTDGFSPVMVNTKKLIVPKQSVIDTIVNSNEFKAKQDTLTEVQLNNINNAITSISINNIEQVNTNGTVNLTIPNATTEQDGMMSKADKTKLDSLNNYILPAATTTTIGGVIVPDVFTIPGLLTENHLGINSKGDLILLYSLIYNYNSNKLILQYLNGTKDTYTIASTIDCNYFIRQGPKASITENGVMSKEDKTKLDSQPTIKANNATGVTDDDYVVIKKSEYQSILDRLSALENKA